MTIIAGIDTETTGFNPDKGDRIIEICASLYELESRRKLKTWTQRINPQRPIPIEASDVHGIVYADVANAPVWREVSPTVLRILNVSDVLVAHNAKFDVNFLIHHFLQEGLIPPEHLEVFDTMDARWATWDGKNPSLQELCFSLQVEYDTSKAHAAEYDVDVMMRCLFEGLDRGFYKLSRNTQREAA